jgi:hypothetical protein
MIDPEYFERKKRELGFERVDQLTAVQAWLDERYPATARAKMLHCGVLRISAANGSVAADIRMRQVELLTACRLVDTRLAITISSLD